MATTEFEKTCNALREMLAELMAIVKQLAADTAKSESVQVPLFRRRMTEAFSPTEQSIADEQDAITRDMELASRLTGPAREAALQAIDRRIDANKQRIDQESERSGYGNPFTTLSSVPLMEEIKRCFARCSR